MANDVASHNQGGPMRIRRPVAAAAAALVLGSGVVAVTATAASAHERPGHSQGPRPGAGHNDQRGTHGIDRWLESRVDRTVTPEAKEALQTAREAARNALRSALETAGSDAAAREAAWSAHASAMSAALLAFDTATLPADQVAAVTAYRAAIAGIESDLRTTLAAAKDQLKASTDAAREEFRAAMAAATTWEERKTAIDALKTATRPAREAFAAAMASARDNALAGVEAARTALEAAIPQA